MGNSSLELPPLPVAKLAKRDGEKRPTIEGKEAYDRGEKDLLQRKKRPSIEGKEAYDRGKRDLLHRKKRPTIEENDTYERGEREPKTEREPTTETETETETEREPQTSKREAKTSKREAKAQREAKTSSPEPEASMEESHVERKDLGREGDSSREPAWHSHLLQDDKRGPSGSEEGRGDRGGRGQWGRGEVEMGGGWPVTTGRGWGRWGWRRRWRA